MFRKRSEPTPPPVAAAPPPTERITSVLGVGVSWKGQIGGSGGVRIEGTLEGDVALRGLLVVGETGRVNCQTLRANTVIVAGSVKGDIVAERLDVRSSGRVWGNVTVASLSTEEGAFLRGQITMEDKVDIGIPPLAEATPAADMDATSNQPDA
jgi:cytoskeletal protein CcmA (bactofilin family)